ncbi:MAG: hypothetical protein ACJ8F7_15110 [Gemmataceae bacterium]
MRRVWTVWRWTLLLPLAALGCTGTPKYNDLRPNRPEEYVTPPEGTYTGAVQYPKEYLNQTGPRKDGSATDGLPPSAGAGRIGASTPGRLGAGQ